MMSTNFNMSQFQTLFSVLQGLQSGNTSSTSSQSNGLSSLLPYLFNSQGNNTGDYFNGSSYGNTGSNYNNSTNNFSGFNLSQLLSGYLGNQSSTQTFKSFPTGDVINVLKNVDNYKKSIHDGQVTLAELKSYQTALKSTANDLNPDIAEKRAIVKTLISHFDQIGQFRQPPLTGTEQSHIERRVITADDITRVAATDGKPWDLSISKDLGSSTVNSAQTLLNTAPSSVTFQATDTTNTNGIEHVAFGSNTLDIPVTFSNSVSFRGYHGSTTDVNGDTVAFQQANTNTPHDKITVTPPSTSTSTTPVVYQKINDVWVKTSS